MHELDRPVSRSSPREGRPEDDPVMGGRPRDRERRAILVAAILPVLISFGCSAPSGVTPPDPSVPLRDSLGAPAPVPFAAGKLRAHDLGSHPGGTSARLALDERYALEFLPVSRSHATSRVAVVLSDVSTKEELARRLVEPVRLGPGEDTAAVLRRALTPDVVDLSRFAGREVDVRWTVDGPGSDDTSLALVRLRGPRGSAPRPDILVVCSDTHRHDFAPPAGTPAALPRLARFSERAVVYTRAYSTSSWTLPAIASVLSGRFPRRHRTGHREHLGWTASDPPPGYFKLRTSLVTAHPATLRTLGEELQDLGYDTVVVTGNTLYGLSGLDVDGFDVVLSAVRSGPSVNAAAGAVLRDHDADRPLFLLVHFMDVHDWFLQAERRGMNVRGSGRDAEIPEYREVYADSTRHADRFFGELLDAWDARRGRNDSVVVFFSDHGEHLFEPGHSPHGEGERTRDGRENRHAGRLVGHGRSMQEILLRVPLMVRYPDGHGVTPGANDRPASLVDIMPTILELAGRPPHDLGLDGRSLLSLPPPGARDRPLFADYQLYDDELSSVRQADLKLVSNLTTGDAELYDLTLPLDEARGEPSRAVDRSGERARLQRVLDNHAASAAEDAALLRSDQRVDQDAATEALRSLGYAD